MSIIAPTTPVGLAVCCSYGLLTFSLVSGVLLLFIKAPYGRYACRAAWYYGPKIDGRLAWILQELPAFLLPCLIAAHAFGFISSFASDLLPVMTDNPVGPLLGKSLSAQQQQQQLELHASHWLPICLRVVPLLLFVTHYAQRTFVFPMRMVQPSGTPFVVFLMAAMFCVVNGTTQACWLLYATPVTGPVWFAQTGWEWVQWAQLCAGAVLFVTGMYINISSDSILRALRTPTDKNNINNNHNSTSSTVPVKRYLTPKGGWFEYVSCANYFGECLEWFGLVVATGGCLPAVSFWCSTMLNLVPRALSYHRDYKDKIDDYPVGRHAIFPYIL